MTKITTAAFMEMASVMIIVLDKRGTIKEINKKGCEILGYEKIEVEGKDWFEFFVPEESRKAEKQQFRYMLRHIHTQSCRHESRVLTRSREERLISWDTSFIGNRKGAIINVLRSGEDVTEKRALQKKLAAAESVKRRSIMAAAIEAQEKERFYLARELHDGVNQVLTTCTLLLELELQQGSSSHLVKDSYQHLKKVISDIRHLSHELNPAQLEAIGLKDSLEEWVKGVNATGKVKVILHYVSEISTLDPSIALTLFRIVQEGVNNIIKHAKATEVVISLNGTDKAVELEIADNGRGFDKTKVRPGLGLKNIQSRAQVYGGLTFICTAPNEGCTLSVFLPLNGNLYSKHLMK